MQHCRKKWPLRRWKMHFEPAFAMQNKRPGIGCTYALNATNEKLMIFTLYRKSEKSPHASDRGRRWFSLGFWLHAQFWNLIAGKLIEWSLKRNRFKKLTVNSQRKGLGYNKNFIRNNLRNKTQQFRLCRVLTGRQIKFCINLPALFATFSYPLPSGVNMIWCYGHF